MSIHIEQNQEEKAMAEWDDPESTPCYTLRNPDREMYHTFRVEGELVRIDCIKGDNCDTYITPIEEAREFWRWLRRRGYSRSQ